LSRLEARQGRVEACRAHAAEASALAEQFGVRLYRIWVQWALLQLELGLGDLDAVARHGAALCAMLYELGIADVDLLPTPELVEAERRRGRPAASLAPLVDEYSERANEKGLLWPLARAARCRGLVADDPAFDGHFREALLQHELTSDSFERGRSHLCYGE